MRMIARLMAVAGALLPIAADGRGQEWCAARSDAVVPITLSVPVILAPLLAKWQATAKNHDPRIALSLATPAPPQGALDAALAAFLDGKRDAALLTRELAEADLVRFRRAHGNDPVVMPVAGGSWTRFGYVDPVVVIVNASNPIARLDLAQIDAIFSTSRWRGHRAIVDWGDAGVSVWRGRPIRLVGGDAWSGEESARALTIRRHVLSVPGQVGVWRPAPGSGGEADNVERVTRDPLAMGFTGAGHVLPGTRIVPIAPGPDVPAMLPTREAVAAGTYPLARTVDLLVARRVNGTVDPRVARLARFLIGRGGQDAVRTDGVFLPLTRAQHRTAARLLRSSPAC